MLALTLVSTRTWHKHVKTGLVSQAGFLVNRMASLNVAFDSPPPRLLLDLSSCISPDSATIDNGHIPSDLTLAYRIFF